MQQHKLSKKNVRSLVQAGTVGAYRLGERTKSEFATRYVGRSDTNLQRRLLTHARRAKFGWFQVEPKNTIFEAFQAECRDWHLYGTTSNHIHPDAPRNLPYKCPYCLIAAEAAMELRGEF